jgi:hypothetical protein
MTKLIKWSAVSEMLTGSKYQIRADYNGKKYKAVVDEVKNLETNCLKVIGQKGSGKSSTDPKQSAEQLNIAPC